MRVLLDTCVLSELRKPNVNAGVCRTIQRLDSQEIYLSVLSVGEILKGIAVLPTSKKKKQLHEWVVTLEQHYKDRLLPIDLEICRIWGELTAAAQKKGRIIPMGDALIASTAMRHGLHIMTRNIADFEPTGALVLNPWE